RIRVVSKARPKEDVIEVSIADTGPGMSKATIQSIFEPGFTTKPAGHGFGLSTSYRIISLHGGQITAESEIGRGATFRVVLPVRASEPA
ncbi:MAG TPA: ATP-binding protein, partial [Candidatus Eisenbacteria bacterium]|nr:ATP-binding protein [Candidatus Eisenbacteria bacterium]